MYVGMYVSITTPYACCSFEPIFIKINATGAGPHMHKSHCFGNNWPNRKTDKGEKVPPKPVFWVNFRRYELFWGKNLKTIFGYPFFAEKVIFIFVVRRPIPSKMVMPPKIFFAIILENIVFFWKNCQMKNILNLISYKKGYINFCR